MHLVSLVFLYTILQGFFNASNRTGGRNVVDVIHKNQDEGTIEIEFFSR